MAHRGVAILKACAHKVTLSIVMVSLLLGAGSFYAGKAYSAQLTDRSLMLSSNRPGEHDVAYRVGFTLPTGGIQSFRIEFCSNSALIEDTCTAPWGFDALNATVTAQTGTSGFMKSPASGANSIVLTNPSLGSANAGPVTFSFDTITNPTSAESYYAKVFTYFNTTASGPGEDFGAVAFPIIEGYNVNAEVPPHLIFCQGVSISGFDCGTVSGNQINLGALSSATSSVGQSQIMAATNAESGYAIFMNGITMTSGNNVIPAIKSEPSKVGTSQFGVNVISNTVPDIGQNPVGPGTAAPTMLYSQQNRFRFVNGERLALSSTAQDYKKFTVSYLVNVSQDQPPGVYSTTLTYTCVANF